MLTSKQQLELIKRDESAAKKSLEKLITSTDNSKPEKKSKELRSVLQELIDLYDATAYIKNQVEPNEKSKTKRG